MTEIQSSDKDEHNTRLWFRCDHLECGDVADYRLEAHWPGSDAIPLWVCLVHFVWGVQQLQGYRVDGKPALHLEQFPLVGHA